MRFWLFLLAPALLAQTQPPEPPQNYWHFQAPKGQKFFAAGQSAPKPVVVAPKTYHVNAQPKVCSVPLVNVLKDKPDTKLDQMAVPLPNGEFAMKYVTPPAPPCDDEKR
jgi:hypothetical protein